MKFADPSGAGWGKKNKNFLLGAPPPLNYKESLGFLRFRFSG